MITVWKYEADFESTFTFKIPEGGQILTARLSGNIGKGVKIWMWFLVESANKSSAG